jgi:hypothetical protein
MKNELTINLQDYSKELLIELILYAHENELTFNEAIVSLLKKFLEEAQD